MTVAAVRRNVLAEVLERCAEEEGGVTELAFAVHLPRRTVYRVMRECSRPSLRAAVAVAMYLEVTVEDVLEMYAERA